MNSPEDLPEEIRQANELINEALAMEPQDLLDFQHEFSERSKRVTTAAAAGRNWVENRYSGLRERDFDTFVYFCGQKAVNEYLMLTEIVETGMLFNQPVDSMQTLAYYRNAQDTSMKIARGMFE